ncbi:MAG: dihydroorotase [Sphingobacteriales bacterium]|nr:dihydroorotase [Sphingobacteriales bacterium]
MKVLIKQAIIVDSSSPFNGQTKDIFIENGIIRTIADTISEIADQLIEAANLSVSIGWIDSFSHFCDPGYEHRETLETGAAAAAAGGFTDVLVLPNTSPSIQNKSQVEYIIQKSKGLPVTIHPIGAISKNAEGKELAEMYDMHQSGAIAFSDGINSIQAPDILLKALQYVLAFDGTIIQLPEDKSISPHGLVNEGIISTQLGLPGKPAIAEELMIARDIELVKYTNSKIHFTGISTQKGIELINKAKAEGVKVTCSATPYHIYFCDEDLTEYDTNLKVNPPLRTKADMLAVREAVKNGEIDCLASHHIPQNWDNKVCEFEYAKNGMIGLETLFGTALSVMGNLQLVVQMLTVAPRKIFNLSIPAIKEGTVAKLTLFDASIKTVFEESMIHSRSKNSAFIGKALQGKVIGIINGDKITLN